MLAIKPQKIMTDLLYICSNPSCKAENWMTLKEVQTYGKVVCFSCNSVTPIEPISGVSLDYSKGTSTISSPVTVVDTEQFIQMLISLGHRKVQAKAMVDNAIEQGMYQGDDAQFIQYLTSLKCG